MTTKFIRLRLEHGAKIAVASIPVPNLMSTYAISAIRTQSFMMTKKSIWFGKRVRYPNRTWTTIHKSSKSCSSMSTKRVFSQRRPKTSNWSSKVTLSVSCVIASMSMHRVWSGTWKRNTIPSKRRRQVCPNRCPSSWRNSKWQRSSSVWFVAEFSTHRHHAFRIWKRDTRNTVSMKRNTVCKRANHCYSRSWWSMKFISANFATSCLTIPWHCFSTKTLTASTLATNAAHANWPVAIWNSFWIIATASARTKRWRKIRPSAVTCASCAVNVRKHLIRWPLCMSTGNCSIEWLLFWSMEFCLHAIK